jgi:TatA/E family protein of Tat protein translocase
VQASLLGVGAPEVLVIGVVALLVFGPKGLAEVARTLGNSLRAFQPTIRELQQVSKEFKSTLEQEIGLDELSNPSQAPTSTPISPFQQPTIPFKEGRTPFHVSLKHLGVVYMCLSLSLQNLNNKIPSKEKRCAFGKYC